MGEQENENIAHNILSIDEPCKYKGTPSIAQE